MKRTLIVFTISVIVLCLSGCSLSLLGTPTPIPTLIPLASPTPFPTATSAAPTAIPTLGLPTPTSPAAPTATTASAPTSTTGTIPGSPSGPYGVIQVAAGDVLNIRSAPGADSSVVGTFTPTANTVMRTGPSANVGGDHWVQIQNPGGGTGWVNAAFLTEYVAPAAFCADTSVNTLLTSFANAIKTSNGESMFALVSPAHGMAVRLWRNGTVVVFDQPHAQYIFDSTYEHNWGAAPGSGLDSVGAIHVVVLPKWLDVLNAPTPGYTLSCNLPQTGGASYDTAWPAIYKNINFYSIYKPGPTGNELSWRTLLVGVEYVQGHAYIFSVTQLGWEP